MASSITPQYYYLTGRPAGYEEWLMQPSRLAEKWWADTWYCRCPQGTFLSKSLERVKTIVSCTFLNLVGFPLFVLATVVNRIYREKIKPEDFAHQTLYWQNIVRGQTSNMHKDSFIVELIKARITSTVYQRIIYTARPHEGVFRTYFGDGPYTPEMITEVLYQNRRCLFLVQAPRYAKWDIRDQKEDIKIKHGEVFNGIHAPDKKSKALKTYLCKNNTLPENCDGLVLLAKTRYIPDDKLEDPRIRRRLQEVLLPPQQLNEL